MKVGNHAAQEHIRMHDGHFQLRRKGCNTEVEYHEIEDITKQIKKQQRLLGFIDRGLLVEFPQTVVTVLLSTQRLRCDATA